MSMLRFNLGAAAVYAALLAGMLAAARERLATTALWHEHWLLTALAAPVMGAWLGAEVVRWLSPRRLLDRRVRRWGGQLVCGAVSAVLGAALLVAVVPVADGVAGDPVLVGLAAVIGAVVVTAMLRRLRPGRCLGCGYSLEGLGRSLESARCPECGRVLDPDELGIVCGGGGRCATPRGGRELRSPPAGRPCVGRWRRPTSAGRGCGG